MGPAPTIMSQIIGGTLFGIIGLVHATPLTAAIMTAFRKIYFEGVLEKQEASEAGGNS